MKATTTHLHLYMSPEPMVPASRYDHFRELADMRGTAFLAQAKELAVMRLELDSLKVRHERVADNARTLARTCDEQSKLIKDLKALLA